MDDAERGPCRRPAHDRRRLGQDRRRFLPIRLDPGKAVAPYAIGKAAQEALLGGLAREVAGTGVTVNMVLVRTIDVDHKRDAEPSPKTASWTTPEEISAVIGQLFSDEARAVNGAKIPLFGNA